MLKPLPMKKVRMIGLLEAESTALSLWRRLGVIQLEKIPIDKLGLEQGKTDQRLEDVNEALVRVRGIRSALKKVKVRPQPITADPVEITKSIKIKPQLIEINNKIDELKTKKEPLFEKKRLLQRVSSLEMDFATLPNNLDYTLFSVKEDRFDALKTRLEKKEIHNQLLSAKDPQKEGNLVCLLATKEADINTLLSETEKIDLPDISGGPRQALLNVQYELARIDDKIKKLDMVLQQYSEKYYPLTQRLSEALRLEQEIYLTAQKFGSSKNAFYAEGWIKKRDLAKLVHTTQKLLDNKVTIQEVPYSEHKGVGCPTVLENPKIIRPFQFLVEFFAVPKNYEYDPSIFLLFTIPIAYGMIVGDAGYALISLILAGAINRFSNKGGMLDQFSKIWMIGALPTFIFGVIYNEYFGLPHEAFTGGVNYIPTILNRHHDVLTYLTVSILLGWITMMLGYILGAIIEWNHNRKHAYAKLAWMVVLIGGTLAVGSFMLEAFSTDIGMIGLIALIFGAIALFLTEGVMGMVEIPALAGNVMSYSRIAAVGMAGVLLAELINTLIKPDIGKIGTIEGALGFILMTLAFIIAHSANAFLHMFEGFIHGARLSVLEFFNKFFHGGGVAFKPFVLKREYTVDTEIEK